MVDNPENEEKVVEPSEEEKVVEPSEFEGGPTEAAEKFFEEKAKKEEKPSEEETKTKPEEKILEQKPGEEEVSEEKPPEARLWVVDEKGNKTPLIVKADGKYHAPDKADTVLTWSGLGVHANTIVEGVKRDKEEIEKTKPILNMLLEAYKNGKITVEGKPLSPSEEEKVEEEEEEDEGLIDPEVAALKKSDKKLRESVKELQDDKLKSFIHGEKAKLDAAITEHRKTNFAAIVRSDEDAPKEIWDLLAEKTDDGTGAKYTVEQAMKIAHDSNVAFAKKLMSEHPEEFGIDENVIYAKKLKEKQEKEEAPVSSPSETPAVVETKSEEVEPQSPAEGYEMFRRKYKAKQEAGRKS